MQVSKSRIYVIMIIGMAAVLSVALVFTAVSMKSSNGDILKRSKRSESCTIQPQDLARQLSKICEEDVDLLEIKYGDTAMTCNMHTTKAATEVRPTVKMNNVEKDGKYTLLMLDPDAPNSSIESMKFFLHWAITNIEGKDIKNANVQDGKELIGYMGPSPPSGDHRYQFILLQSTNRNAIKLQSQERPGFDLESFVKENKLCNIIGLFQFRVKKQNE